MITRTEFDQIAGAILKCRFGHKVGDHAWTGRDLEVAQFVKNLACSQVAYELAKVFEGKRNFRKDEFLTISGIDSG